MKPIITVYSRGTPNETKKFDGYITAAFWVGLEHLEGDLESVKIRQPNESYDLDVTNLAEFASLLVQRQINFSVEYFTEPPPQQPPSPLAEAEPNPDEPIPEPKGGVADFEKELERIKEDYDKGIVSKKQYESRKGVLLKRWREKVEGRLGT